MQGWDESALAQAQLKLSWGESTFIQLGAKVETSWLWPRSSLARLGQVKLDMCWVDTSCSHPMAAMSTCVEFGLELSKVDVALCSAEVRWVWTLSRYYAKLRLHIQIIAFGHNYILCSKLNRVGVLGTTSGYQQKGLSAKQLLVLHVPALEQLAHALTKPLSPPGAEVETKGGKSMNIEARYFFENSPNVIHELKKMFQFLPMEIGIKGNHQEQNWDVYALVILRKPSRTRLRCSFTKNLFAYSEEATPSLQNKQSIKDRVITERTVNNESLQKEKKTSVPSSSSSPPRNLPVQTELENQTKVIGDPVHVRKTSFGASQPTDKEVSSSLASVSQVTTGPKAEIQKTSPPRLAERSMAQVAMMSRPSSAPLVPGGPRPAAAVVSMVQTAPLLARSVSATGRLGPDPSPATHSYVPQSYRNAMMGNPAVSTAASLPHCSSSSGVNSTPGYSQPQLVSSPLFLSRSSDKLDSNASQSGVPFSVISRDVLQNGPNWIDSSHREASRNLHYEPPSRLNDVQNLDLYKPVDSRSLGNLSSEFPACTSRRQNQGGLVDEFPHLDIINDLLDEEHVTGKAAKASSAFHSLNDGPQLLNRQFTFPGDLGTNDDLGSSTSSCRFERSRSYQDARFQQGYSSSGGRHFDMQPDYLPQTASTLSSYGNGKVDGLTPNQWQVAGSDLSYLGMRNTENSYSYYQDYPNMACGVNGYTVFRPSNGP
ncbi:hypothetical protein V8G54_028230 [Vigna mungo]|uniref:Uncharacterized protein n=1 Tax=Vigna mungo TaxID=3915 RepID=A0AAQ3MSL4_VIGMU